MHNLQTYSHSDRWSSRNDGASVSLLRPVAKPQPLHFDAKPKPIEADIARSAMLIIDMQNDFLATDGWFATSRNADVSNLSGVVNQINTLSGACRNLGAPVIHINWAVRPDVANLPANVLDKAQTVVRGQVMATKFPRAECLWTGTGARNLSRL